MTKNKEKVTEDEKHRDTNQEKWDTFTHCGNEETASLNYLKVVMSKQHNKTSNTVEIIKACEIRRPINSAEVVFTN
jgi:hypothetical protein